MHKKIDLTGQKIGRIQVLEEISAPYSGCNKNRKTTIKLRCLCACGREFFPYKGNVLRGLTTGCLRCANAGNFIGKKIGHLQVIERAPSESQVLFKCVCECGNSTVASSRYLSTGKDQKCEKCRYPKKFSDKPKLTRKEATSITSYNKFLKNSEKLIGKKFALLKVLKFSHWEQTDTRKRPWYTCKCKCGVVKEIRGEQIGKAVKSCGCLQKLNIPRGERSKNATLSNNQADAVRGLLQSGLYTGREVAQIFEISENVVSSIKNNATYKNRTTNPTHPADMQEK